MDKKKTPEMTSGAMQNGDKPFLLASIIMLGDKPFGDFLKVINGLNKRRSFPLKPPLEIRVTQNFLFRLKPVNGQYQHRKVRQF